MLLLRWVPILACCAFMGCQGLTVPAQFPDSFSDCANCPAMVVVPAGRFPMGFDGGEPERYEGPVREVSIERQFAVGQYEVSNAEYAAFIAATDYESSVGCWVWDGRNAEFGDALSWRDPGYGREPKPNEPVVCVDWHDAQAYAAWLAELTGKNYRLLSEAEWEYAARAGSKVRYAWGTEPKGGCRWANIFDLSTVGTDTKSPLEPTDCNDGFPGLAPVGSLEANAFGLYDMTGNVWEWARDCYVMPYPAEPANGDPYLGPEGCDRRSARGGSWITGGERQTVTFRGRDPADQASMVFGFRIARDVTQN